MKPFIIIGANLTGLCTALALSRLGQFSVLVDRSDISAPINQDGRAIALSYGSKQILEEITDIVEPVANKNGEWYADYVRLRFVAVKE